MRKTLIYENKTNTRCYKIKTDELQKIDSDSNADMCTLVLIALTALKIHTSRRKNHWWKYEHSNENQPRPQTTICSLFWCAHTEEEIKKKWCKRGKQCVRDITTEAEMLSRWAKNTVERYVWSLFVILLIELCDIFLE